MAETRRAHEAAIATAAAAAAVEKASAMAAAKRAHDAAMAEQQAVMAEAERAHDAVMAAIAAEAASRSQSHGLAITAAALVVLCVSALARRMRTLHREEADGAQGGSLSAQADAASSDGVKDGQHGRSGPSPADTSGARECRSSTSPLGSHSSARPRVSPARRRSASAGTLTALATVASSWCPPWLSHLLRLCSRWWRRRRRTTLRWLWRSRQRWRISR